MDDTKKTDAPNSPAKPGQPGAPGAGQPPRPATGGAQSSTLASHTLKPLGGMTTGAGSTAKPAGAGQGHSAGPEHNRHQDKDAGQGLGAAAQGAADQARGAVDQAKQTAQSMADAAKPTLQAAANTAKETAKSAADTVSRTAEQVQEQAGEAYEEATQWAREKLHQATDWASEGYEEGSRQFDYARRRSMQSAQGARRSVESFVSENPVLVGFVGLAAGLLLGALLPRTRQEDRYVGRWADEVRDQGMRYARDITHRGREFVEQALSDDDAQFASPERDRPMGGQPGPRPQQRSGPAGRYQNH